MQRRVRGGDATKVRCLVISPPLEAVLVAVREFFGGDHEHAFAVLDFEACVCDLEDHDSF